MLLLPHNPKWGVDRVYTGREDNILWERDRSEVKADSRGFSIREAVFRFRRRRSTPSRIRSAAHGSDPCLRLGFLRDGRPQRVGSET